ncbi:MAG: hypothetical protein QOE70_1495 [Chthoniobacter sp.]|jgi:hypothetical protein|nr:hypothetical protein [Chthoniobacter sp.]
MRFLRAALFGLLTLALASCSNPRTRAEQMLRKVGAEQLRRDAAFLYKDIFAAHETDFIVIRPKNLPASFQRFEPVRAGAYQDGITITLKVRSNTEAGLYVVPMSMDSVPSSARGGQFQKLAEGIYWYSFGE